MRFNTQILLAAAALTVSAPALAQNTTDMATTNGAEAGNTVGTGGVDNMTGAPAPGAVTTTTGAAAAPGAQDATLPPTTDGGAIDTAYARGDDEGGRFPWGVLGVLGLLGLLGRRRRDNSTRA